MNSFLGALIAALIAGLTATLVVLTGEDVTSLGDITGLQWTILVVGVAITGLKDFQAITARRVINSLTGSGDGGVA